MSALNNNLILNQLQDSVLSYLGRNKNISLNGLSKRCSISEPTLRRIKNGQIKTLPTLTTIIDLLCSLNKVDKIPELIEIYKETPIGAFLNEHFSVLASGDYSYEFNQELDESLRDNISYLIFKLSCNTSGVTHTKIKEMFGKHGTDKLEVLEKKNLIKKESDGETYKTAIEAFSLGHEHFVEHFKAVADFIKTGEIGPKKNNLFYNFSESVNEKGMREILQIQRLALKKIAKVLNDKEYTGEIPLFVLSAIDTLDLPQQEEDSAKSKPTLH
ncbi:MAG: hypothetical protein KC493_01355 [Bacteriovoracaceae bacterium]|nr:hypothetical protein [Bacteriovoracaceae bacterium]